ncbi:MAG: 2-C-methyl-D-erythritol 4-phosphate cytidylyltransferase [Oscillospiraceae bacterium]|nr:2-C-methyl-D-erythritol 4-phosphate cytidylyltransferase [Oscillospiraceae bacterium]
MHLFGKKKQSHPYCAAIIVAAGNATRMCGTDKIMAPLGLETVIVHAVRPFQRCELVDEIVVVTREDLLVPVSEALHAAAFDKVHMVMVGGQERIDSVMAGLDTVSRQTRIAAIHDGARPLVTEQIVRRTIEKATLGGAAAPAVPVKDTIKVAVDGVVTKTPDRATLFAVQTPQVFDRDLLRGALQKVKQEGTGVTDDCMACERLGKQVYLTEGSEENIKITTPSDLMLANAILSGRELL